MSIIKVYLTKDKVKNITQKEKDHLVKKYILCGCILTDGSNEAEKLANDLSLMAITYRE